MLRLKPEMSQSNLFQIISTLIIVSLIVIAEIVLIGENAAFLQSQGKSQPTAVALSTCVALLIPVVSSLIVEDRRWYIILGQRSFVASLIAMQVYFASQTAIAPQIKEISSGSEMILVQDYKTQLQKYDDQIESYQKHIDSFPESFRTKRAELSRFQLKLIDERRKVLNELRELTQSGTLTSPTSIGGFFKHLTILITIFYRLALEIGVVILTWSLRKQFTRTSKSIENKSGEVQSEPTTTSLENPDEKNTTASSKDYVLSIYPQAYCKSKNGRQGPYVIYASRQSEIKLAEAKGQAITAWHKAAQKLRRSSTLQSNSRQSSTTPYKVYAIKS